MESCGFVYLHAGVAKADNGYSQPSPTIRPGKQSGLFEILLRAQQRIVSDADIWLVGVFVTQVAGKKKAGSDATEEIACAESIRDTISRLETALEDVAKLRDSTLQKIANRLDASVCVEGGVIPCM